MPSTGDSSFQSLPPRPLHDDNYDKPFLWLPCDRTHRKDVSSAVHGNKSLFGQNAGQRTYSYTGNKQNDPEQSPLFPLSYHMIKLSQSLNILIVGNKPMALSTDSLKLLAITGYTEESLLVIRTPDVQHLRLAYGIPLASTVSGICNNRSIYCGSTSQPPQLQHQRVQNCNDSKFLVFSMVPWCLLRFNFQMWMKSTEKRNGGFIILILIQNTMVREPFSLTYIVYDKDDGLFGWMIALMSLAPVYVDISLQPHHLEYLSLSFALPSLCIVISTLVFFLWKWFCCCIFLIVG